MRHTDQTTPWPSATVRGPGACGGTRQRTNVDSPWETMWERISFWEMFTYFASMEFPFPQKSPKSTYDTKRQAVSRWRRRRSANLSKSGMMDTNRSNILTFWTFYRTVFKGTKSSKICRTHKILSWPSQGSLQWLHGLMPPLIGIWYSMMFWGLLAMPAKFASYTTKKKYPQFHLLVFTPVSQHWLVPRLKNRFNPCLQWCSSHFSPAKPLSPTASWRSCVATGLPRAAYIQCRTWLILDALQKCVSFQAGYAIIQTLNIFVRVKLEIALH